LHFYHGETKKQQIAYVKHVYLHREDWKMKQLPRKNKIRVQKGHLEYINTGNGVPTVILINGSGGPLEGWYKIIPELAEISSIVAYNRFGIGGSDKPSEPQHGTAIVESLKELLSVLQFQPPYLLVGHSLGGLYANLFARLYPKEVIGVVLLEASHPNDLALNQYQGKIIRTMNKMLGLFDFFSKTNKLGEVHYVKETVDQINRSSPFPDIPLYVVTGGKKSHRWLMPTEVYKIRMENQKDYVRLSNQGKQLFAPSSGHFPQITDPEIVLKAVKDCIQSISG
jgi:pimeloyl-ACP methyl ester carboxylesterase